MGREGAGQQHEGRKRGAEERQSESRSRCQRAATGRLEDDGRIWCRDPSSWPDGVSRCQASLQQGGGTRFRPGHVAGRMSAAHSRWTPVAVLMSLGLGAGELQGPSLIKSTISTQAHSCISPAWGK